MNNHQLTTKHCVPCEGGTESLSVQQESIYLSAVPDWSIMSNDIHKISKVFHFKNFDSALKFVNKVGEIAETEGHHPDIFIHDYKMVTITLHTYAIKGLSENDFIMAARINQL